MWSSLGGCDDLYRFWENTRTSIPSGLFWQAPQTLEPIIIEGLSTLSAENTAWEEMHKKGLLPICRSPLLLGYICGIFRASEKLPSNNGKLFEEFVNLCLDEELDRKQKNDEITNEEASELKQKANEMMSYLAKAIIIGKEGTGILTSKGHEFLKTHFSPNVDIVESCEKLSQGAKILSVDKEIRFAHQLLQEYFASKFLLTAFNNSQSAHDFWNQISWWENTGWEEPAIISVGIIHSNFNLDEVNKYLLWLANAQPSLVVRCLERAGIAELNLHSLKESTKLEIQTSLIARLEDSKDSFQSKVELSKALGRFEDSRNGVGVKNKQPDIKWLMFLEQNNIQISKYPITVAQFFTFISAEDGYQSPDSWMFSNEAIVWYNTVNENGKRLKKWTSEYLKFHSNEPVINVTWFEACAFCHWLTKKQNKNIRIPTEKEWCMFQSMGCQRLENGLSELIPVGLQSAKIESVSDIGLVWEWCGDIFGEDKPISTRILKGGSWKYGMEYLTKSYRFRTYPTFVRDDIGFRIIIDNQKENRK